MHRRHHPVIPALAALGRDDMKKFSGASPSLRAKFRIFPRVIFGIFAMQQMHGFTLQCTKVQ